MNGKKNTIVNPVKELIKKVCLSVTGSDPKVLRSCLAYAKQRGDYFICEATVNQVNQYGGYTGMKPADYARMMSDLADEIGFDKKKLILAGDHLGPFAWQDLEAEEAMQRSEELIRVYVAAGFRKIHLDTTIPLKGDDPDKFGDEVIAERAVRLAKAAEETYEKTKIDTLWSYRPVYVIGSEVPVPGGSKKVEKMEVTKPEDLEKSIICFKNAFINNSLKQVWDDTVAVVAQIGLEFSEDNVYDFNYEAARSLADKLKEFPQLVFESHSSDYQTPVHLQEMVMDGVGILKVGPELTFEHRAALFSLAAIEDVLAPAWGFEPSHFVKVLDQAMVLAKPDYWSKYYHGNEGEKAMKRAYSYSDRARYYFTQPEILAARRKLIDNLSSRKIPLYMLSQYAPVQYKKIREGDLPNSPEAIVADRISSVVDRYYSNMLIGRQRKEGNNSYHEK